MSAQDQQGGRDPTLTGPMTTYSPEVAQNRLGPPSSAGGRCPERGPTMLRVGVSVAVGAGVAASGLAALSRHATLPPTHRGVETRPTPAADSARAAIGAHGCVPVMVTLARRRVAARS